MEMKNFSWENVGIGGLVMLYGICGVFLVLILFYLTTKLMVNIANKRTPKKENE